MGANYTLFVAALVALVFWAERAAKPLANGRALFVGGLAVVSASAVVLRASSWSITFAVPVSASLVALLPVVVRGDLDSLAGATLRALAAPVRMPRAASEVAAESAPLFGASGRRTLGRVALGLVVGAPIAAGFAVLLAFDSRFTGVLDRLFDRAWGSASVVVWGIVWGSALLLGHRALAARPLEPPPTRRERPYRQATDAEAPAERAGALVAPLTWSIIVAQTAAVFLLYAAVNARAWFAGHGAMAASGETYATYLHAGFIQLLLAAVLSVGMVLIGHFLLRPYGRPAEGPVAGGKRLAAIEIALLAGTALALVSCAQRLAVYVEAYGATYERLAVGAVCIFVAFVVGLTAWKAARRDFAHYASFFLGGAALIGTACAVFDADGTIARVNVARAANGQYLDVEYLSGLSCDARPVLAAGTLDADARERLDAAWAPEARGDLRGTRGIIACGR